MNNINKLASDVAINRLIKGLMPMTGITHPIDRVKAIELFEALIDRGCGYEPQPIYELSIKYGWSKERALELANLADLILADGYAPKELHMGWGKRIVDMVFTQLSEQGDEQQKQDTVEQR
jgi:hypothetical protein